MRSTIRQLVPLVTALAIGACNEVGAPIAPTAPSSRAVLPPALANDRVATIGWEGSTPALYIQNADGSDRKRVHFDHVTGHVAGNYSFLQLPVTDESISRFVKMKWSPDGRFLAVILAPSTEALQIVLVTADGLALRTVSPNSQYIWGDVEWSPDSRRIAYIMATGPYGSLPDIFVTELGADRVTRVTTGARLSGYDAIRFDSKGERIFFSKRLGWADDGMNGLTRLGAVDLATGAIAWGDTVVGEAQGFSREGSWGLFTRWSATSKGARELFRRGTDGRETVLAVGDVAGAAVLEGDRSAVLANWSGDWPDFSEIGVEQPNDVRAKLTTVPATTWAALWRAPY